MYKTIYESLEEQAPQGLLDLNSKPAVLCMLDSRDKTRASLEEIWRLFDAGWEIWATSGTANFLEDPGKFLHGETGLEPVPARNIADLIHHSPAMGHRMASCSWETNSGLISDQSNIAHDHYLFTNSIPKFQLLIDTVYGLDEEMANPKSTWKSRLEKTDFGGPAALRAAAKGRRAIVFNVNQLEPVITRLLAGDVTPEWLEEMAAETEFFCAHYAGLSAANISNGRLQTIQLREQRKLRYGENPYQSGWLLAREHGHDEPLAISKFEVVSPEREPSFVNITDLDDALKTLTTLAAANELNGHLWKPFYGVAVKHGIPVGLAMDYDPSEVIRKVFTANRQAAYGCVAMFSFPLNRNLAGKLLHGFLPANEKFRFFEGLAAPEFTGEGTLQKLGGVERKKLLLRNSALLNLDLAALDATPEYRPVRGGTLVQTGNRYLLDFRDLTVYGQAPDQVLSADLLLAWSACACTKSNCTAIANDGLLVGNGASNQDRVGSCRDALSQAGDRAKRGVAVTCSFFPAVDGLQALIEGGVRTVMACSGSAKVDQDIIELAAQANITLIHISAEIGKLFSGH